MPSTEEPTPLPEPVGAWHPVSCEKCKVLQGWTRKPPARPVYCLPCFEGVAHLPEDET